MRRVPAMAKKTLAHLISGSARLCKNPKARPARKAADLAAKRAGPARPHSPAQAGQETAPATGLALRRLGRFGEFVAWRFIIDAGIVRRPHDGDDRRDRGCAIAHRVLPGTKHRWRRRFDGALQPVNCPAPRPARPPAPQALSAVRAAAKTRSGPARGGASIASSNGEASTVTPLSDGSAASGVCHWNASSRPVTGDTGRQRSDTYPSAVHTGSCAGANRAQHPRPRAAGIAVLAALEFRHQHRDALGRARDERRQHAARARANSVASMAARATASALSIWPGAFSARVSTRTSRCRAESPSFTCA